MNAAPTAPNVVTVSWNDSSEPSISEYRVSRSRNVGGPYQVIATIPDSSPGTGGGAGYQFNDPDVSGGITYHYIVRGSDGGACQSEVSNVATATATGVCTLPPLFDGVVSVTNPQSADCELDIAWDAGAYECGSSLVYNVYRSTSSGFMPDPSNVLGTCLTGTSMVDTTAFSGDTYHYIVRAEDNSGNGAGLCAGGNEDGNTVEASGAATGPDAVYFADDMESGDGNWTHAGTGDTWNLSTARAYSGVTSFKATDVGSVTDQNLDSLEFALPAIPGITLEFWSWQEIEYSGTGCYDGGIVEASTDGGSSWTQLPDASMLTLPYDGPVSTSFSNPIGGQNAWCGDPRDWTYTVVDLTAYAGSNVKLRFRMATDSSVSREGWYIDDVRVITPPTATAPPSSATGSNRATRPCGRPQRRSGTANHQRTTAPGDRGGFFDVTLRAGRPHRNHDRPAAAPADAHDGAPTCARQGTWYDLRVGRDVDSPPRLGRVPERKDLRIGPRWATPSGISNGADSLPQNDGRVGSTTWHASAPPRGLTVGPGRP